MESWITIVITGAAIAGYGLLLPKNAAAGKPDQAAYQAEAAYDRLLEDLEAENRELIDAVSEFKREQDATVDKLSSRIREMERQMTELADRERTAEAKLPTAAAVLVPAAAVQAAAASEASSAPLPCPSPPGTDKLAQEDAYAQAAAAKEPEEAPAAPAGIKERYASLMELHGRGRSIEQIAKELSMNKGEIQLILQLARREEKDRA
ncbi:DUF6115 domain-containing protein [Cohnella fermenti]|uniref:Uncharacterized protein n=1 Tax=Cohnella fermenti TaxID=2565925 RepID=A0A4S4C2I4_9BACL|nr:hypothetical protein [Cohnella fermenti]THF81239.1 hypothetical protein E6C55_08990 [Cohnella fermenti]